MKLTLGIDASNLSSGGGRTHLIELLDAADPAEHGIERIVIWSCSATLVAIHDKPWLDKRSTSTLDGSLLRRVWWQIFKLPAALREAGCEVLFVPGGSHAGNFHPVVTMSQNLLPFVTQELQRYHWSWRLLKLLALRRAHVYSFRRAEGVIFLTDYARAAVLSVVKKLHGQSRIIEHGLNPRFRTAPKPQNASAYYDDYHPYRVLYVSTLDDYKHQWHVVDAVAILRKQGLPIALDLIGPSYSGALKRLNKTIGRVDPVRSWVNYLGAIPFEDLHRNYSSADLALFASSCESMPIILMEKMASGLPIACSRAGPMPAMLSAAGARYFDPEQPNDIACTLRELFYAPKSRATLADVSYGLAEQYSWKRCASETFEFIAQIARRKREKSDV